ncbi:MAG: hypothetical protein LBS69_06945 [Prevotellaceae bacterium]|jgi:hypothetical protein|nr:hypothetical protein [Prevotellaceae bacterium]
MKLLLLTFLAILLTFTAFSQQVTFSKDIQNSIDENVKQIAEVWEKYIQKYQQRADSAVILYWNSAENNLKNGDIIGNNQGNIYYRMCKVFTYNIKPGTNKDFYEINCLSLLKPNDEINDVCAVFRVCAAKENDEFKLYNYFYTTKDSLNTYSVDGIEYYYPCNFVFDKEKAQQASEFLKNARKKYNLPQKQSVVYVVANSVDECNELTGFHYTVASNPNPNAGAFRFPNILVAAKVDHIHELTHSIFDISFINSSTLSAEGIATYYGGNAGIPFADLKPNFLQYITEHPDVDLSDFYSYNEILQNGTNPFYFVGALIIDYSMKNGGEQAVLRLFEYNNDKIYDLFLNEFGVKRDEVHNFILKLAHDE